MPVYLLEDEDLTFPNPKYATEDGLVAIGGDLSEARIISAYESGIFPWYSEGEPILWWSPDPRCVLYPENIHIQKSMRKKVREELRFVTADKAFDRVIEQCAQVDRGGQTGTWITPAMIDAYKRLHKMGVAHSVEVWQEGRLAGGLYGLSLGAAFFGESMFSLATDASKLAVIALARFCQQRELEMIDCQVTNRHLLRMGAVELPREDFLGLLYRSLERPSNIGSWISIFPESMESLT